jgi:hypothetical protein
MDPASLPSMLAADDLTPRASRTASDPAPELSKPLDVTPIMLLELEPPIDPIPLEDIQVAAILPK